MQTGMTSFLDRMIAGSVNKSSPGDPAQRNSTDESEGGLSGRKGIAYEFSRIIRSLRSERPSEVTGNSTLRGKDEETEALHAANPDAEANGAIDTPIAPPGLLMLLHKGDDADGGGDDEAVRQAMIAAWRDLRSSGMEDGETGQNRIMAAWRDWQSFGLQGADGEGDLSPDAATGENAEIADPDADGRFAIPHTIIDPQAVQKAVAEGDGSDAAENAATAIRNGPRGATNEAAMRDVLTTDEGEGDLAKTLATDGRPPVRTGDGAGADGSRARMEGGENARAMAARGSGQQIRVDVLSTQTFMPPTQSTPSTIQLLSESVGEAIGEMANARLPGEAAQDGKPAHEMGRRLVIELHPRELGSVRVSLVKQGGELHIEIIPTTDKANDLLNSHRDALASTIRNAGSAVTEISVRLSQDGGMGREFQSGQNGASNWSGGNGASDGSGESGNGARHSFAKDSPNGQQWQGTENRPENGGQVRNGIYL